MQPNHHKNPLEAKRPASPHTFHPERERETKRGREGVCDKMPERKGEREAKEEKEGVNKEIKGFSRKIPKRCRDNVMKERRRHQSVC